MKMKQTAVEWLSEVTSQLFDEYLQAKFGTIILSEKLEEVTNQAKEMEKEQIEEAFAMGNDDISSEQYYNETYNTPKE